MNEQKHSMTGVWALGALDPEEREQVRRYLEEDPEAAAEAAEFEETAAELAGGLPPLAPRPELKAAVMARIGTTRQLSPLPEQEDPHAGSPTSDATAPAPSSEMISLDRYRASVRLSRWTTIAAVLMLVTTIAGVGLWSGERIAENDARASLEAMASAQAEAEHDQAMLSSILASEDAAHMVIPSAHGGSLQLMYSREQQAMYLQGAELPALPGGEVYQLWMIEGSGGISDAGMLEDPSDPMVLDGAIPEDVTIGLTIEPAGGSEQPTMTPIATGVLS